VHAADAGWLRTGHLAIPAGVTPWGGFMSSALRALPRGVLRVPPIEPDLVIDDSGLDLAPWGVEGRVVHTPGHTPGSVSVLLPGGDGFVGDLAMNGPPLCLRPSFGVLAHEPERVPESWRRLLALGLRRAYPAHGHPFEASALRA
jgi:hydroxyacylglutathione hydrolase